MVFAAAHRPKRGMPRTTMVAGSSQPKRRHAAIVARFDQPDLLQQEQLAFAVR